MMKVIVAGAGPGAADLYTERTKSAIANADIVLTSARLTEGIDQLNDRVEVMGVMETVAYINNNKGRDIVVCVIASGDTGFYSIATTIQYRIDPDVELELISATGSLSYFAAKIKIGYEAMKLISLHGKESSIIPFVCYNETVFTLTGGSRKAHDLIQSLVKAGLGHVTVYVGEKLSMDGERILSGSALELSEEVFDDLTVMVVHNKNYVNKYATLKDDDFVRGESPMTKEAVRNLSVAALELSPSDVVYDIGAGTGSVTCAMALKANESTVYAMEKEPSAVALLKENMRKLGVLNIEIIQGIAPDGLDQFPPADKVFIGGSTGNLKDIVDVVLKRNPNAVFVVTAVTLETIAQTTELFTELDFDVEITCANISTAHKLGRYNLMKAENPVYIFKGVKKGEE